MTSKENLKSIAKAVGYGFFVMSIIETWHCLSWFFDGGTWQDVVYSVVSAPLINFVEMTCFGIWFYFKKDHLLLAGLAFMFGVLFASVSVFGSVGWVGVKYDVNVKSSGEYQRLEGEHESWQKLADDWTAEAERRTKEKGGQGAMYAKEQAQKMQTKASEVSTQLASFTGSGGSGNALFNILAEFWNTSRQNAAARGAAIFASSKEAVMIFLFIFVMMMEQAQKTGKKSDKKTGTESGKDEKKKTALNPACDGEKTGTMPDFKNEIAAETRRKILALIAKKPAVIYKKNGKLNAEKIAELTGTSSRTVRRVLKEEKLS